MRDENRNDLKTAKQTDGSRHNKIEKASDNKNSENPKNHSCFYETRLEISTTIVLPILKKKNQKLLLLDSIFKKIIKKKWE